MNKAIFFAFSFFSIVATADEMIIDVPALAGKSKLEVSKIIGAPKSCSPSKYGEKCQFETAETEIVFINGKADWITVESLDTKPFADSAIKLLGFKPHKPTFSSADVKRWEPLQGLLSVSIFKGSSNADYAYIKVSTK